MRIGIDASFLDPAARYTGMGVYARRLVEAMAACASTHETVLLGYGPAPALLPAGLRWQRLEPLPAGKLGPWLSHQYVLPRAARSLRLDVLHVPGVNVRLSQPGVPFEMPCPLVVTMHDAIPLAYYGRLAPALPRRLRSAYRLALLALRRAALILTVSASARRDILRYTTLRPERVRVVLNGLDAPRPRTRDEIAATLRRLRLPASYLLYAGSYEPRKNVLGAVAAYRLAAASRPLPPLVLLVERDSGHRAATMRAVADGGSTESLHFVHSLTDDDLAALYRGATLFLYPSFYEGFGFPPLQALACGIPVIASNAGALPEVLGPDVRYCAPDDTAGLAAALLDVLADPEAVRELAERGPRQAGRYSWTATAQATLRAYEWASAAGRRVAA